MGNQVVKFHVSLNWSLTKDSWIEDCIFEGYCWGETGDDACVSRGLRLKVSGCKFSSCVSGTNRGCLFVRTVVYWVSRNDYVSCGWSQYWFVFYQARMMKITKDSVHAFCTGSTFANCHGFYVQEEVILKQKIWTEVIWAQLIESMYITASMAPKVASPLQQYPPALDPLYSRFIVKQN